MPERICSIDDCSKPVHARDWCSIHYGRWRHNGDPLTTTRKARKQCSIDGCEQLAQARTWCKAHWSRWKWFGDPEFVRSSSTCCIVDGCAKPPRSAHAEYCEMHYGQIRRNGVLGAKPSGGPWIGVYCVHCGEAFIVSASRKGGRAGGQQKFCSTKCKRRHDAAAYSSRLRNAPRFEVVEFPYVIQRDGGRCYLCSRRVDLSLVFPHPKSASLDHLVPLARGGDHTLANVRLAHLTCNKAKATRAMNEQLLLIG